MCVFRWIQEMWGDGIANFLLITGLFSRREMLSKTLAAVRQSRVLHPGGVKTFLPILLVFTDSTTMIWHEEWRWHHWSLFWYLLLGANTFSAGSVPNTNTSCHINLFGISESIDWYFNKLFVLEQVQRVWWHSPVERHLLSQLQECLLVTHFIIIDQSLTKTK